MALSFDLATNETFYLDAYSIFMSSLQQRIEKEKAIASDSLSLSNPSIIGVDEVGRGCLAGPVMSVACSFVSHTDFPEEMVGLIRDSKKLSARQRLIIFRILKPFIIYASASASVEEIDSLNILQATMLSMQRAVTELNSKLMNKCNSVALVDGNRAPELPIAHLCVVKGDAQCVSIAAASIIAKILRDRLMQMHHMRYPEYGWQSNAGYGSKQHKLALQKYGATPLHRQSFAPVRETYTRS